jgi:hypothetical protein
MGDAWNYAIEAIRTHPFNAFTLLFAVVAIIISVLAWRASYRQKKASERQATAAETQLDFQAKALQSQAEALRTQSADTAKALEIAEESANALKAQAGDTHAALEIARQNAEATERLAEVTAALAISGQRGWLVVFKNSRAADHHWEVHNKAVVRCFLLFKNIGKTAITDVHMRYCTKVSAAEPTDYYPQETKSYATVPPNGDIPLNYSFDCNAATWEKLNAGTEKVYFYGNAIYFDVFGQPRTTVGASDSQRTT